MSDHSDSTATTSTPSPRDYAPLTRRLLSWLLTILLLTGAGWWAWQQPFMAATRMTWETSRMPPPAWLPVPVQGVEPDDIAATFGAPRGSSRSHEGLDIFAMRGTPVLSTTRGIVASVRDSGLGGKQVWVLGPARERHYYAHLDGWAEGLSAGDVVFPGTSLGFVGATGNARGTPPHLHYGIYAAGGALDPLPRLRADPIDADNSP